MLLAGEVGVREDEWIDIVVEGGSDVIEVLARVSVKVETERSCVAEIGEEAHREPADPTAAWLG